jgi:hypothetical protein
MRVAGPLGRVEDMTAPLTDDRPPAPAPDRKGVPGALELIGTVIAALCAQALVRTAFDSGSEPLWGLFRGLSDGRAGQVVLTVVLGLLAVALAATGHLLRRRRTSRPTH